MINYRENYIPTESEVFELYSAHNWLAYTKNMSLTMQGIKGSLFVVSAYCNSKLVGLVRVVGDGATIIYIQDLIIDPKFLRKKIGKSLMDIVLARYSHVRQKVLLTDASKDNEYVIRFYKSLGFDTCDKGITVAMARFDS